MINSELQYWQPKDFCDSPVVQTSSSDGGSGGLISGWGAKFPHASWWKNQNIKKKKKKRIDTLMKWLFVPVSFVVVCYSMVQFSSVTQSCLTLCNPMNCSMPGLPVHHQLPEFTQTHVHQVGDAIQPSHPLSSPSPPALNLSQHQGLFQ